MADSKIQWTSKTWNPVVGCSKVSAGCAHCYAETMAKRLKAMALQDIADGKNPGRKRYYIDVIDDKGRWNGRVVPVPEALGEPLKWKKPQMVFVNSMSDLFHEDLPFEFIDKVFAVMAICPQHTFQVLTKRPGRMAAYGQELIAGRRKIGDALRQMDELNGFANLMLVSEAFGVTPFSGEIGKPPYLPFPNVCLGTSVENQATADERIPLLLRTPAAVRFVSYEPALGPVDFGCECWLSENGHDIHFCNKCRKPLWLGQGFIDQVIVGGESGHNSRRCHIDWIRRTIRQCEKRSIAAFDKQLGARLVVDYYEEDDIVREWALNHRHTVLQPFENRYVEWDHQTFGQPAPRALIEVHLKDRKGGDMEEWPESLRVRQFPQTEAISTEARS